MVLVVSKHNSPIFSSKSGCTSSEVHPDFFFEPKSVISIFSVCRGDKTHHILVNLKIAIFESWDDTHCYFSDNKKKIGLWDEEVNTVNEKGVTWKWVAVTVLKGEKRLCVLAQSTLQSPFTDFAYSLDRLCVLVRPISWDYQLLHLRNLLSIIILY